MSLVQLLLLALWGFAHTNANRYIAEKYEPKVLEETNPSCPSAIKTLMVLNEIEAETNLLLDGIIPRLNQTSGDFYCEGGGWTNVAYINMDDSSHHCPQAWKEITQNSHRACGRKSSGCQSVTFNTSGKRYNKVCGRIIAYQYGNPEGFQTDSVHLFDLNSYYIDGVSLTRGNPRKHIWSFVMGQDQTSRNSYVCPCVYDYHVTVPSFIGKNYSCDAALTRYTFNTPKILHTDNPLWDGENCGEAPNCCNHNSWFNATLPTTTSDSLEVRICSNEPPDQEDARITLLNLYVK